MSERVPCGHGSWSVATSSEGTSYCQECEQIGRLWSEIKQLRAMVATYSDTLASVTLKAEAELEQLCASREVWATRAAEQEARAEQAEAREIEARNLGQSHFDRAERASAELSNLCRPRGTSIRG